MEEHIIRKEDGSIVKWNKTKNNGYFCVLYNDNKQKYSFSPVQSLNCQLFMIGGGGAGGYFFGGGGGAGAAYMNNNFTFEKNKSYSFEIGTGGKCDIDNINNLFKTGLNLKVYNNTTPKLNNVSFSSDDYSSLGFVSSGIVQSFTVNNINIPSTIFNNNTTYIWDGYIKANESGFIKVNINSKIKTMIWIDKTIYTNASALIDSDNISDVKFVQLDTNKFYNVKIIAYNFDTSSSNFNIIFENCQLYNFDKNSEIYNYVPATDTNLIYRSNDNNAPAIIKCKGGGFGGCGLYNQNNNLDGGCGGGSGINKKNGKALIDPSFNGNDGAIGAYCGGGGGIMSAGINDKGGDGKKIDWFDNDLIFGAGGNAATFKENRTLGYGCGGNGAECCYFSKLLINNDGNNGCVLIYVNANGNVNVNVNGNANANANGNVNGNGNGNTIEGFANLIGKQDIYLSDESIINNLIKESFNIILKPENTLSSANSNPENRYNYYTKNGLTFASLCQNESPATKVHEMPDDPSKAANIFISSVEAGASSTNPAEPQQNNMNNFIYDMIVISKLYAVVYRLYYHHFSKTLNNDINRFTTFLNDAEYTFSAASNSNTEITETTVNINSLFNIENLKLNINTLNSDYVSSIYGSNSAPTDLNMSSGIYNASKDDIGRYSIPSYHNLSDGTKLYNFDFFNIEYSTHVNKINLAAANRSDTTSSTNSYNTEGTSNVYLNIFESGGKLNKINLYDKYDYFNKSIFATDLNIYEKQRVLLYLEQFNIIFNTTPSILLSTLKYKMYYYNAIVYNVLLQYNIFNLQKNRISSDYTTTTKSTSTQNEPQSTMSSGSINSLFNILNNNLNTIITSNINTPTYFTNVVENVHNTSQKLTEINTNYETSQSVLNDAINKYNNDLDVYNTMNYYYKIIIAIAIIILIFVILIFAIDAIDINTKIMIFAFIALIIIVLYIIYNSSFSITENFVSCRFKYIGSGLTTIGSIVNNISINNYKTTLYKYSSFIMVLLSTQSITKNTLHNITTYIDNTNDIRTRKILYNKNKITEYKNASELLKKSANDYYYLILLIVFGIIILMFGMSLYLLYPTMLLNVAIFAVIPFIILVFYVMYKINRSTRMVENKNYWATFNPSEKVLATL